MNNGRVYSQWPRGSMKVDMHILSMNIYSGRRANRGISIETFQPGRRIDAFSGFNVLLSAYCARDEILNRRTRKPYPYILWNLRKCSNTISVCNYRLKETHLWFINYFLDLKSVGSSCGSRWDLYAAIIGDYQVHLSRLKMPGFWIKAHICQIIKIARETDVISLSCAQSLLSAYVIDGICNIM